MTFYLRIIRKKSFWLGCEQYKNTSDVTADLIQDFRTTQNSLSVWHIETDKSNLNRILAAYACTQENIRQVEYAILPSNLLSNANFNIIQERGKTPDLEANDWHRDIINLTGDTLLMLSKIFFHNCEPETLFVFDVCDYIQESVKEQRISNKNLNKEIKPKIEDMRNQIKNVDLT